MVRYHNINGERIQFTAEEETERDLQEKEFNDASGDRKLAQIKQIRLQKLQETDYLANSDVTMPDNIKTWRQSLRNLPQDFSTEEQYDLLLARETDKTKDNFGKLTHSIWSKP
ncbi:hypothetical protein OAP76_00800 [Alphaproteobacteria bacterium]|nr:hypothetical protein [Alphaproteobacteria bacterium]